MTISQTDPSTSLPQPSTLAQTQMPLSLVSQGDTVLIANVRGGKKMRQRLLDLGLNQGGQVRIIKNEMPGPLIIAVKEDGRLALGRGMCQKIMVTPMTKKS